MFFGEANILGYCAVAFAIMYQTLKVKLRFCSEQVGTIKERDNGTHIRIIATYKISNRVDR